MANNDGVILTSTLWNQSGTIFISIDGKQTALTGYSYNKYCPLIGGKGTVHSVTGCSNTADSQLLYYWLEKGYELNLSVSTEDFYYLDGDATKYYASSGPTNGEASIETINGLLSGDLSQKLTNGDFIAALNFYCGLKNHSEYADSTSTSWNVSVYTDGTNANVFEAAGFDSYYFIAANAEISSKGERHPVAELFFSQYTETQQDGTEVTYSELTETAFSILRENFDYGEVVRVGVPGHAIYMDGYRFNSTSGEYEYHLNYGWGIKYTEYSKWYTVSELKDLQMTYITIDLSPDIDVLVSNDSSEYTGGSFLRGVERINHIQNETVSYFEIAEELSGKTISMTEQVNFTSEVDVEFTNFNINYVSTAAGGIVSERDMCFDLKDVSIAVNNAEADVAVQGRMLDFSLDNSWIFAGYLENGLSGIASVVTEKDSLLLSDFDSTIREAAAGTALAGGSGDDVITISNGSVVFGDIDLGGGSNSLTITNGSLLCGNVTAEDGTLSLKMEMTYSAEEQGALIIADSAEMETSLYDAAGGVIDVHFNDLTMKDCSYTLIDGYSADVMDNFTVKVTQNGRDDVISLSASAWKVHSFSLSFENGDLVLSYKKEDQVLLYYGDTLVSSATTMTGKLTDQWKMYIAGDGRGTAEVYSGGLLHVNGGISSDSKIYSSGYMAVSGSGSAKNTGIYAGGIAGVENGYMYDTVLSGGELYVRSGGVASETVINTGGVMTVSGGEADNTVVNTGGAVNIQAGTVENTTVSGGEMIVSGGVVTAVVLGSGGVAALNGGIVSSATVNSGGKMNVSSGGILDGAVLSSGAQLFVSSGATAENLKISSGAVIGLTLAEDTVFQGIRNGSSVEIQDGVLNGYTVENGGFLNVESGAVADNTVVDSGNLNVYSGGTVSLPVVNTGGIVNVSGGMLGSATVAAGGVVNVFGGGNAEGTVVNGSLYASGGVLSDTVIGSAGTAVISSGGKGYDTAVSSGGTLVISSGGAHYGTLHIDQDAVVSAGNGAVIDFSLTGRTVEDDFLVTNISNVSGNGSFTITVSADMTYGNFKLADGAGSFDKTISIGDGSVIWATLSVNGKGWRGDGCYYSLLRTDNDLYLTVSEMDTIPPEAPVASADIQKATRNAVTVTAVFASDSILNEYSFDNKNWHTYSKAVKFTENGTVYFRSVDAFENISEVTRFDVANIDKNAPVLPETSAVSIKGTTAEIDWADSIDNGTAGLRGYRVRYGTSAALEGAGQFVTASSITLSSLTAGTWYYQIQAVDNAGNYSDWSAVQNFSVAPAPVFTLQGSANGIQWNNVGGAEYFVECSSDKGVISLKTNGNSIDILGLPSGSSSWRVSADGGYWSDGVEISGQGSSGGPQKLLSDADGNMDVFFARADGVWDKRHAAGHLGSSDGWQGTSERILLDGKNRLTDVFGGSTDSNVLLLTDDSNGDALFLDDIFSAFGNEARLTQINEIRAGNGNDIIDLTSQRYDFTGDTVKIHGGLGHDVIWANKQNSILFGDAGNDRIIGGSGNDVISGGSGNDRLHGGGGKDIFCFGGNWGRDEVEQLDDGKITLVIENGSIENWDAENRLYSSGKNAIQVIGNAEVSLVFEADPSLPEGVFASAASEKIFEDKNKGMLA